MTTYYCSTCAGSRGLKSGIDFSNPLGTPGQLSKFNKHTSTSGASGEPVRTVFDSTNTSVYCQWIEATITYGFVELAGSRKNIGFVPSTGSALGRKLIWGVERQPQPDGLLAVNTSRSTGLHLFLENSSKYSGALCARCGGSLW
jgi:hypothetical protein